MMNKFNIAIVGARGYTGQELIRYLLKHPLVEIKKLMVRNIKKPLPIGKVLPEFKNILSLDIEKFSFNKLKNIDVLFLAIPHTQSMRIVPKVINNVKLIIDLSADYRFENYKLYERIYKTKHLDRKNLEEAVYGLPEIFRSRIKGKKLIANPGCYPTSILIALYPLAKKGLLKNSKVIVDSKSGVSGAGKKLDENFLFSELNENLKPYNINIHRHQPEVSQILLQESGCDFEFNFIPQIVPLKRGIISMVYVIFKKKPKIDIYKLYKKFYNSEPFVRILGKEGIPEIKNTAFTNFIDLGFFDWLDKNTYLIISSLDNLGKGASSQAIQNMNIALGIKETLSLL